MADSNERLLTPLAFIDNFISITPNIRKTFMSGYCYYFALIMKEAMQRGTICWACPFSHVVWKDEDGKAYDIDGEYVSDAVLIPIDDKNRKYFRGLLHNENPEYSISKEDMKRILYDDSYEISKKDRDWIMKEFYGE